MPLRQVLIASRDAYTIAEDFCRITDYPLDRVVAKAQGRPTAEDPLLTLHPSVLRKVDDICRHIVPDTSRWTTTSRSRWGLSLLQVIATLALTRNLKLLQAVARGFHITENQQTTLNEKIAGFSTCVFVNDSAEQEPPPKSRPDVYDLFRTALHAVSQSQVIGGIDCIPENYGIDLQGLRRLTDILLGPMKRRADVNYEFEAATPRLVVIDRSSLTRCGPMTYERGASVLDFESTIEQGFQKIDSLSAVDAIFPAPQWDVTYPLSSGDIEKRLKSAITAVRRKRVTVTEMDHVPFYAYGVPRECEMAFSSGLSIIVSGIGGTGKSTILSRLPTLGATVFEIGTEMESIGAKRHHYRFDQVDQLLKKARRTKGRKILICHEFFISQDLLPRLSIFDQFAFAGDPRQPGAGDAQHLFKFIRAVGGRQFTLRVVWRVGHPLSTMVANHFAYGCQFKLCERAGIHDDRQFDLIECEDTALDIAECMVAYALEKSRQGRSVTIAANSRLLVAAVARLVSSISDFPSQIQCRYLSDLQGRETDTLVFDLHDAAASYLKPDEALRFVVMLLGRARYTTSIVLGKRNMASDRQSALPVEVFFGVLLRYRIRSGAKSPLHRSGPHFESFSKECYLSLLDDQTIRVYMRSLNSASITIIKDRNNHNALMMMGFTCLIEAPSFFVQGSNLEIEIALIHRLVRSGYLPNFQVNSLAQIEEFVATR